MKTKPVKEITEIIIYLLKDSFLQIILLIQILLFKFCVTIEWFFKNNSFFQIHLLDIKQHSRTNMENLHVN